MSEKWKRLTALAIAGAISAGIGAPGSPFGAVSTVRAGKISTEDKDVPYIQENLSEEVQYLDVNGEVNPDRIIEELAYDKKLIGCDITFKIKNPDQKSVAQAMLDYITEQFGTDDFNAVLADYVKQKYPQAAMESEYTFLADTAGTEWNPEVFKETVVYDAANSSGHCSLNICRNNSQQEIGSVSIYFTVEKEQTEAADKWVKKDGVWYYYNADGQVYTNQWIKSGSKWCYVDESGAAYAGKWAKIDGKWYYFNSSAYMLASQWIKSGSKWSYVNSGGAAYVNAWMKKNGTWYYFDANAYMLANKWLKSGNKWYYFDDNGMMTTGWVMTGGEWYYMGADGIMRTGWQKIGNNWYYMYENGAQASEVIVDGYYLKSNGVMMESPVASKGQKEKKWVLVGDSRTMQLANQYLGYPYVMNGKHPAYIGSDTNNGYIISQGSMGLSWMKEQDIDSHVDGETAVIINMGTNDAAGGKNAGKNYADWLNKKAETWTKQGAAVWFVSTGPVYEPKAKLTNANIQEFNAAVKSNISEKVYYLDLYPCIYEEVTGDASATDEMGVHYKKPLYEKNLRIDKKYVC